MSDCTVTTWFFLLVVNWDQRVPVVPESSYNKAVASNFLYYTIFTHTRCRILVMFISATTLILTEIFG